jgi:hypothetical protein
MRLTKHMRDHIFFKAMGNVPSIDYAELLAPVVQVVLCAHMPDHVRRAYDNAEDRKYLKSTEVQIREGNGYNGTSLWLRDRVYGVTEQNRIEIRVGQALAGYLKKGTREYDLYHAVLKSGYFQKHIEQQELLNSVKNRLRANLDSVNTVKRLYDVLEPELHHLIPKEADKTANLPSVVAPVVDDLRKLGADLPTVAKAAK